MSVWRGYSMFNVLMKAVGGSERVLLYYVARDYRQPLAASPQMPRAVDSGPAEQLLFHNDDNFA
jgi:hypothetical protein